MTTVNRVTATQHLRVLRWLESGAELTPLQAWQELGIGRLAARIRDLRLAGHAIETRIVKRADVRFASYSLVKQ